MILANHLDIPPNTPEHGLDEYSGETLFRLNDEDRAEFILHSDASTPGMVINTRTNGVQLYLGEKPDVLTSVRSTATYTDSQFSSVVQWHGDASTVGELSYFQMEMMMVNLVLSVFQEQMAQSTLQHQVQR